MTTVWYVYMLLCADKTLYTGITTDLNRRLLEHNSSQKGAKYSKTRRPVVLIWSEKQPNRSEAAKREWAIKQLTRSEKERLSGVDKQSF
jgi:putative endonuclease